MNIIELHNYIREQKGLPPFEEHPLLNEQALKAAHWMARRGWHNFWNFNYTRNLLIGKGFIEVDYNIAVGNTEDIVLKHIYNTVEKRSIMLGDFKWMGWGSFSSLYTHWAIIYSR